MYKILKVQSEAVNPRKADNKIDKILMGQSEVEILERQTMQ